MKNMKIIRIFGVAFILTLLFTLLPISPAFSTAYYTLSLYHPPKAISALQSLTMAYPIQHPKRYHRQYLLLPK